MTKAMHAVPLALLFIYQFAWGGDTTKVKAVKILPVPAFGYSPETSTYVGAVSLFTFRLYPDSTTRHSNAKVKFTYTWRQQIIVETGWNFFSKDETWFTKGDIVYSKFPDFYFGIGANTLEANKLTYTSNRFLLDVYALKKIRRRVFSGFNIKYVNYWGIQQTDASPVNIDYKEVVNTSTAGLGYSILKDDRNNILSPTQGIYAFANATYHVATSDYIKLFFDARYYHTWKSKYTFASRFVSEFNTRTPPFFDYAAVGGDKLVRGYYYGRYRDNHLSTLQVEFRFPIVWRIGLATFGGASTVYRQVSSAMIDNMKYNGGVGLRFMIDRKERTNLRLDYAVGNDNSSGFYVAFGESF